jgi:hypothetical protein
MHSLILKVRKLHIQTKNVAMTGEKNKPLRWIVERTFSWFNGSRRLDKDFEMKSFYQEHICIISNFATILRRF